VDMLRYVVEEIFIVCKLVLVRRSKLA
jgi:hypothetical protein